MCCLPSVSCGELTLKNEGVGHVAAVRVRCFRLAGPSWNQMLMPWQLIDIMNHDPCMAAWTGLWSWNMVMHCLESWDRKEMCQLVIHWTFTVKYPVCYIRASAFETCACTCASDVFVAFWLRSSMLQRQRSTFHRSKSCLWLALKMICCGHVASKEVHVGSEANDDSPKRQSSHNCVQLLTCALSTQGKLQADSISVAVALATILAPFEAAWLIS